MQKFADELPSERYSEGDVDFLLGDEVIGTGTTGGDHGSRKNSNEELRSVLAIRLAKKRRWRERMMARFQRQFCQHWVRGGRLGDDGLTDWEGRFVR